ncbi:protein DETOXIFICATION 12-like isoform X2 [Silene latifolia]|uniref:protein DETOXIFICATION 12-like isoform X2 n=1 Tax=Silene latifolia TaxID=37657 RepID=UPI003D77788F
MEEGLLLVRESHEKKRKIIILEEMKRVSYIAGPMVAVLLSQYLHQVVTQMMAGHLGELYLSSTALAISLSTVTGYSFLMGMASALETISGQAYGAQQYKKLGTQTYTAIFSLALVCIPISILWINMGQVLVFIGQDPSIAHEAGRFSTCLVPGLFAYAILQPLNRYFQVQSLVMPMVLSSCTSLCIHILLCWLLVYKSSLKNLGAAISMSICIWLNAIFLALFMKFSPSCEATRSPLSMEIFHGIAEFFRFAIPSATMTCLGWWSLELQILLSGLLPNPELETSVLSVCLTTTSTLFSMPYGIGAAARNCEGMWMATYRCRRKPCCILSYWNSDFSHIRLLVANEGTRSMDWDHMRCYCAVCASSHHYGMHKLGKTGKQSKGKIIGIKFQSSRRSKCR